MDGPGAVRNPRHPIGYRPDGLLRGAPSFPPVWRRIVYQVNPLAYFALALTASARLLTFDNPDIHRTLTRP